MALTEERKAALLAYYETFGSDQEMVERITGDSKASFRATCWCLWKLSEQGELARRLQGHDHDIYYSAQHLAVLMEPLDVTRARQAIGRAVRLGFAMEHAPEREYEDLGLLELQKKTKPGRPGASIWTRLCRFWAWICGRCSC